MPATKYTSWDTIPNRHPRVAPPSSTTMSCTVNGTGVNGKVNRTGFVGGLFP